MKQMVDPTMEFVAKCIVNEVAGDLLPNLDDRKKHKDKYKKWHKYATEIINGYFVKK